MNRDPYGPGLIGDRAGDGLTNPPRRVCRELVTAAVFKPVDSLHQADVAFLDEVEELQAAIRVLLGNRDDQPKIGFDQLPLGLFSLELPPRDDRQCVAEPLGCGFELAHLRPELGTPLP